MQIKPITLLAVSIFLIYSGTASSSTLAATWTFGSNQNGLSGLSSKTLLPVDDFALHISVVNPPGARFFEGDFAGVTVNSVGLDGITDLDGAGKINLIDLAGAPGAEAVSFSFDRPGVLTGLDFDGIKDESLEFFVLTSTAGMRVNFFDSYANTSIPGAVDDAVAAGDVTGSVVYLLETGLFDDEAQGLRIPFAAGQQFVLTYAELPAVAHPLYESGNGARLQGITVQHVPEPASWFAAIAALIACPHFVRKRLATR